MSCPKAKIALLLAFFGCFSSPADAQINLKTGYNLSFLSVPSLDHMLSEYNDSKGYSSGFNNLRWLHGFEGGIRFKSGLQAIEVNYQGAYQALNATGSVSGTEFEDRLRIAIHSMALGYQLSDRLLGAGTDIQYYFHKVKFLPGEDGAVFKDVQNTFGLKFYVMVTLRGNKGVDMALQPYYVHPFKIYDLTPLAQYLQAATPVEGDRWQRFGLSILFYNGKK